MVEALRVAIGASSSAEVDMNCSITGAELGSPGPLVVWLVIPLTRG